ncbi:hypothetical protein [Haloferula sp.]|uniref:hypothetical protein n=1 Tax=Haloferula sp. TaxID=2497595 RepID=UPI003C77EFD6
MMVLSMGVVLLYMLINSYKTAIRSQEAQGLATLRIDYAAKEDAILRAIIPIASNSAMRCMQHNSNSSSSISTPLLWQKVFRSAILQSNSEASIKNSILDEFGLETAVVGNSGDATTWSSQTFEAYDGTKSRYVSPGVNKDFGAGFPVPLQSGSGTVLSNDNLWPIISRNKVYSTLADGRVGASVDEYPQFNLLPYPNIRFGYAKPGEDFVAKRNWWAFRMDLSDQQDQYTGVEKAKREFVLSIYEVPSQLAISAEAFTVLGKYQDGTDWGDNTSITGGVFATRAKVEAGMNLERISGRRGLDISTGASIGDNPFVENTGDGTVNASDPFAPGVREQYELTHGTFMPVSLTSETGRAAFIPINRGIDFFDRYAHSSELNTLSDTTWNDYTVGAIQCAMHIDITDVRGPDDSSPGELTFRYQKNGIEETMVIDLETGPDTDLPPGYIWCADENQTVTFDFPVDVAYGKNGSYSFQSAVSGPVSFRNSRFGDPLVGTRKSGFYRPSYPFEVTMLHGIKHCVSIHPERFPEFLQLIGADDTAVNHSISINVDYPGNVLLNKPSIPCTELDYGVILKDCANLSSFPEGFSLVTNLRLYIADDFNTTAVSAPLGSGLPDPFYPPCSLFAPEKRYGAENNPFRLKISGQMGSLAGDAGTNGQSVHLLDMKNGSNNELEHDKVEVNLSPITHPGALPPVSMMNWLVVVEERRKEFYSVTQSQP